MVNLTLAVGGLWGTIINWFMSFIPNFGVAIIIITVLIKLLMSPLEVHQKITAKKNAEKQAILQPKLEKLQKQYGNNKQLLNQKQMELYKKENYNVMGSCFGMLINLVLTLTIFITLFSSINVISQNNIKQEYATLQNEYITVYKNNLATNGNITITDNMTFEQIETALSNAGLSTDEIASLKASASANASKQTSIKYGEIKEGFLWIKNIYRPDTWASVFPSADEFVAISGINFNNVSAENVYTDILGNTYETKDTAITAFKNDFNLVTADIQKDYTGWNGWLILVILAAGITVLSQIITTISTKAKKQYDKKGNELETKTPNSKLMLILLPVLMLIFAIQYSAAFALHIVVNSVMSVLIGYVTTLVMNKIEKKKALKNK